jgi:hypothetical protein
LAELQGMDYDLSLLGFNPDELAELLGYKDGLCDPDEVPGPPDEATTRPGDLWILGNHRLACGDSSKPEDVDRLLAGAAALGSRRKQMEGHGQKLTSRQEALIAALLTEPTYATAATKAGVGETTLYRWMHLPAFRAAYRQARRELVDGAIGRIQAGTGVAVEALIEVARHGRRDGDRVRAAVAVLEHAFRGLADADVLQGERQSGDAAKMNPADMAQMLAARLRQLDAADLPTVEKSRLTATLTDALLRAFAADELSKRMEALEAVFNSRKDNER